MLSVLNRCLKRNHGKLPPTLYIKQRDDGFEQVDPDRLREQSQPSLSQQEAVTKLVHVMGYDVPQLSRSVQAAARWAAARTSV